MRSCQERGRGCESRLPLQLTTKMVFKIQWPGSQVARRRSAKPLHMGATPIAAF